LKRQILFSTSYCKKQKNSRQKREKYKWCRIYTKHQQPKKPKTAKASSDEAAIYLLTPSIPLPHQRNLQAHTTSKNQQQLTKREARTEPKARKGKQSTAEKQEQQQQSCSAMTDKPSHTSLLTSYLDNQSDPNTTHKRDMPGSWSYSKTTSKIKPLHFPQHHQPQN